jgi:osmotically-inducible protein OsmY
MSLRHPSHRAGGATGAGTAVGRAAAVALAAALAAPLLLSGCQVLLLGGAALGGAMVATDRRTSGAQVEDQAIEFKARNRVKSVLGERGNAAVTSYNRVALLTGEVTSAADREAVEQAVKQIEGVNTVVNELAEMPPSSFSARSNDALLSAKVKATLFDAKGTLANAYKVVVERNIVYLMGRVTDAEAGQIAEIAGSVPGVQKVVRVFEILSEVDLAGLRMR